MANTYWQDKNTTEILSSHISGLQDAVKNIEQSLDMDTEAVSNYSLTLIADDDGKHRIAEAVGKRSWLNDPAPVIQQYIGEAWTTITTGFSIDYAGGAVIFDGEKAGEQFRASFTRVKNMSGHNTHTADNIKHITSQERIDWNAKQDALGFVPAKQSDLTSHLSDYALQVPYVTATGSANIYSVLLNGVTSYYEGMALAVKINVNNTSASKINVNGLGAKPIKKPNGNDISAGNLKAGSIYSMRYNGVNFILQGSDAAGNAIPGDVLSGKTFSSDQGTDLTGTMPNRGAVIITPGTSNKAITQGYHSGSGYVKGDANLIADNIKEGIEIFGVEGINKGEILQVSDNLKTSIKTSLDVKASVYTKAYEITIGGAGAIKVSCGCTIYSSGRILYLKFYKNGSPVSEEFQHSSPSSITSKTFTFSPMVVEKEDKIQVYVKATTQQVYITIENFRLYYDIVNCPLIEEDIISYVAPTGKVE